MLSAAFLGLSVVNFVGGPNRPISRDGREVRDDENGTPSLSVKAFLFGNMIKI